MVWAGSPTGSRRPAGRPDDHDGFGHRSTTLSLALCARGLTATSWAVAVTGFLVRTVSLESVLNAHLTRRSSSEWKLMIAARPPGASSSGIAASVGVELPELVVDRDPQRLKDPSGRVDRSMPRPAGNAPSHQLGKLAGGLDRPPLAVFHDPAGNPPAEPFLPQFKEQLGQFGLSHLIDQVGRARAGLTRVEPHVERPVGREAETPACQASWSDESPRSSSTP